MEHEPHWHASGRNGHYVVEEINNDAGGVSGERTIQASTRREAQEFAAALERTWRAGRDAGRKEILDRVAQLGQVKVP